MVFHYFSELVLLADVKKQEKVARAPIGPVVSAHNKTVYDKTRELMRRDG